MMNPFKAIKPIYVALFLLFDVEVFFAALAGNNPAMDECYYQPAAVASLHGVAANIEHPPLVKLLMGGGIAVFGDGWFGWRLLSIVCGVISVALIYLISRRYFSERLATFCAGLSCLSVVFVLMGSFAMLDMPCLMFSLMGLYLALRGKFLWSGLAFGLGFLCKELALIMFLATAVFLFYKKVPWKKLAVFGAVAVVVAVGGVWLYDLAYQPVAGAVAVSNPLEHFRLMVVWQLNLNGERAPNLSQWYPPVSWVTPFGANALNPLSWLWGQDMAGHFLFNFRAASSPVVEYLMFPLLFALPVVFAKWRSDVALLSWLWVAASFLPWFLVGFVVLMEGNFYIVYSVPFLAIGCGYMYSLIKRRWLRYGLAVTQLAVGLAFFLYYFPLPLF